MTRANRYFTAGNIWHIVHRRHKKKSFYSNLNVIENGSQQSVAKSMQLITGRTAQEFNSRKKRKGAYWDDRYHATAIDTDQYLILILI